MVVGHHGVRGGVGAGRRSLPPAGGANNGSGTGQGGVDARGVGGRGAGGATLDDRSVVLIPDGEFASLALPLVVAARLAGAEVRTAPFAASPTRSIARSRWSPPVTCAPTAAPPRISPRWRVQPVRSGHRCSSTRATRPGSSLAADRLQIDCGRRRLQAPALPAGVAFLSVGAETPMPPALTASWRGLRAESDFFTIDPDDLFEGAAGLDVSLAWHPWTGARRSLELLSAILPTTVESGASGWRRRRRRRSGWNPPDPRCSACRHRTTRKR